MQLTPVNNSISFVSRILYIFNCGDVLLGNSYRERDQIKYTEKIWKNVEQKLYNKGFNYMGYCSSFSPCNSQDSQLWPDR